MRKIVSKSLFHLINKNIKSGTPEPTVALRYNVSEGTVKAIRLARTWPEWERRKAEKVEKNQFRRSVKRQLEKVVAGKSARPELLSGVEKFTPKPVSLKNTTPKRPLGAQSSPTIFIRKQDFQGIAKIGEDHEEDTVKQLLKDIKVKLVESAEADIRILSELAYARKRLPWWRRR